LNNHPNNFLTKKGEFWKCWNSKRWESIEFNFEIKKIVSSKRI